MYRDSVLHLALDSVLDWSSEKAWVFIERLRKLVQSMEEAIKLGNRPKNLDSPWTKKSVFSGCESSPSSKTKQISQELLTSKLINQIINRSGPQKQLWQLCPSLLKGIIFVSWSVEIFETTPYRAVRISMARLSPQWLLLFPLAIMWWTYCVVFMAPIHMVSSRLIDSPILGLNVGPSPKTQSGPNMRASSNNYDPNYGNLC